MLPRMKIAARELAALAISITAAVPLMNAAAMTPVAHADFTEDEIEAAVIDTCQGSVKKQLRDPDSAKFADWNSWVITHHGSPPRVANYHPENGDKLYGADGKVNAKNGYGGYAGNEAWGCDAAVTTGGNVDANAYSIEDILKGND
jgi:hypothetical protein